MKRKSEFGVRIRPNKRSPENPNDPKVFKMELGKPGLFIIPLAQAEEELRNSNVNPERLKNANESSPITVGKMVYWKP